jgi:hypothetical protein
MFFPPVEFRESPTSKPSRTRMSWAREGIRPIAHLDEVSDLVGPAGGQLGVDLLAVGAHAVK